MHRPPIKHNCMPTAQCRGAMCQAQRTLTGPWPWLSFFPLPWLCYPWQSLTTWPWLVQNKQEVVDKGYAKQEIILGTHTSEGEQNYLMRAEVTLPLEETETDNRCGLAFVGLQSVALARAGEGHTEVETQRRGAGPWLRVWGHLQAWLAWLPGGGRDGQQQKGVAAGARGQGPGPAGVELLDGSALAASPGCLSG